MIWLIGYKGLLGSTVSNHLKAQNISFIKTDSETDITDINSLENFTSSQENIITHIINCAGYTNVDKAEKDKKNAELLNSTGPENLAKIANKLNATLIHISTDYVFGNFHTSPITEKEKPDPISVYGKTKLSGDNVIINNAAKYYILRTAWLFGQNGKNFVTTMLSLFNAKNEVKVVNDQTGSPTYAEDFAEVIIKIIKQEPPYGIYNYTSNGIITWYDFAVEIKKQGEKLGLVKNKDCILTPCTSKDYVTPAKRPEYSVLSKDKIKKALKMEIPDWKDLLYLYMNTLI